MELERFEYKVIAHITFTKEELQVLVRLAERHYDRKCREVTHPGGALYAATSFLRGYDDPRDRVARLSWGQMDTLAKLTENWMVLAAEHHAAAQAVRASIQTLFDALHAESERVHAQRRA